MILLGIVNEGTAVVDAIFPGAEENGRATNPKFYALVYCARSNVTYELFNALSINYRRGPIAPR